MHWLLCACMINCRLTLLRHMDALMATRSFWETLLREYNHKCNHPNHLCSPLPARAQPAVTAQYCTGRHLLGHQTDCAARACRSQTFQCTQPCVVPWLIASADRNVTFNKLAAAVQQIENTTRVAERQYKQVCVVCTARNPDHPPGTSRPPHHSTRHTTVTHPFS